MLFTDPEGKEFQAVQFSNDESIPAITELVGDMITISPTEMSGLLIIMIGGKATELNAGDYLVRKTVPATVDVDGQELDPEHDTVEIVRWQEFVGTTTEEVISEGFHVDLPESK